MGHGRVTMQLRWLRFFGVAALVVILGAGWWISYARIIGNCLHQGEARAATSLRLTVLGLDGLLRRFRAAPALLAEDPHLAAILANPADQITQQAANVWLSAPRPKQSCGAPRPIWCRPVNWPRWARCPLPSATRSTNRLPPSASMPTAPPC